MSTVAEQIAQQIKSDNPSFTVKAYPVGSPDNLGSGKVHVSVWRTALTPNAVASVLTHEVRIEIMVGTTNQPKATLDLDTALDEVLLSVQRLDGVEWSTADYTIFDDKYPGYGVTAAAQSDNVYRNLVVEEN